MPSPGAVRAGEAYVEISTRNAALERGLKSAAARLGRFGSQVGAIGVGMMKLGALVATPFVVATKIFASMGDDLGKMSKRTGISVEALSELKFAAEQSGSSIDALEKGVKRMQQSINDLDRGLSTAKDAFAEVGLSAQDLAGLTPEQQFKRIADGLAKIADPSKRAAVAIQLFGRAGTDLLPMMAEGSAGMEKLQAQARALGLTISTDAAAGAEKLTDMMNILRLQVMAAAFAIGEALMPTILEMIEALRAGVQRLIQWVRRNKEMVVWVAKTAVKLAAVGAALWVVGKAITVVSGLFKALAWAISMAAKAKAFFLALSGPKGWAIIAGAAIVAYGVYKLIDNEMEKMTERIEEARREAEGFADAAKDAAKAIDGIVYDVPVEVKGSSRMTMDDWQALADERERLERERIERSGTAEERWAKHLHEMKLGLINEETQKRLDAERKLAEMATKFLEAYKAQLDDIARRTRRDIADVAHPREIREDFNERLRGLRANVPRFVSTGAIATRGTFNPAALLSMQSGPSAEYAKRTAKAAEATVKVLGKIEKNIDGDVLISYGN